MNSLWNKYKIKQLVDIINGYSFKSELYQDDGINVIRITNVDDGNINKTNPRYYSFKYEDEIGKAMLLENDILMSLTGNVGVVGIVKKDILPAGLNQRVASIRIKNRNILYKFLYYYFRTKQYKEKATLNAQGIAQLNLSTEWIGNDEIFVPSVVEQQKIANFLDKKVEEIDSIIEKTNLTIEDYKKYKQAIITKIITEGIYKSQSLKESNVNFIGKINSRFGVIDFKYLLKENMQYGANESGETFNERLPRYIRITDIDENGKLKEENKLSLSEECAEKYILKNGDILFARSGATVGKSFIYDEKIGRSAFAGYLIKATVNNKVLPRFVYYYTLSSIYEIWKNGIFIQATIQNIGAEKYMNMPIIYIDDVEEQEKIVRKLDEKCTEIDNLISIKQKLTEELEQYKKTLIYEYVTGKKVI